MIDAIVLLATRGLLDQSDERHAVFAVRLCDATLAGAFGALARQFDGRHYPDTKTEPRSKAQSARSAGRSNRVWSEAGDSGLCSQSHEVSGGTVVVVGRPVTS